MSDITNKFLKKMVAQQIERWDAQGDERPRAKAIRAVPGATIREPCKSAYGEQALTAGERRVIKLMAAETRPEHRKCYTTGRVGGQWFVEDGRTFIITRGTDGRRSVAEVWLQDAAASTPETTAETAPGPTRPHAA